MIFFVMWENIKVAVLEEVNGKVEFFLYKENVKKAASKGMIISPLLNKKEGRLPFWIEKRIPANVVDKMAYLKETGGRLETDKFSFVFYK